MKLQSKEKIKRIIGYGFLPSLLVVYIYYSMFMASQIAKNINVNSFFILVIFIALFLWLFKKGIAVENIIDYIGFKTLEKKKTIIYYLLNYLILINILKYTNVQFSNYMSYEKSILFPVLGLTSLYLFNKHYKFSVTFFQITPNTYIDLIKFKLHSIEDLKSYQVIPIKEETFELNAVENMYKKYEDELNAKKTKNKKINRIEYTIEKENRVNLIAFNKNEEIWSRTYIKNNKEKDIGELLEIIKKFENR